MGKKSSKLTLKALIQPKVKSFPIELTDKSHTHTNASISYRVKSYAKQQGSQQHLC